jgi:hypothetical protein
MQVDLTPIGGEGSVNPEYVTAIEAASDAVSNSKRHIKVWVRGHSGYGTYSVGVSVSAAEAREYLNDPVKYLLRKWAMKIVQLRERLDGALRVDPEKVDVIVADDILDRIRYVDDELVVVKAQLESTADAL